eukprot:scaffold76688_cov51-Phaeocystis_antarctica.AAC.1
MPYSAHTLSSACALAGESRRCATAAIRTERPAAAPGTPAGWDTVGGAKHPITSSATADSSSDSSASASGSAGSAWWWWVVGGACERDSGSDSGCVAAVSSSTANVLPDWTPGGTCTSKRTPSYST